MVMVVHLVFYCYNKPSSPLKVNPFSLKSKKTAARMGGGIRIS